MAKVYLNILAAGILLKLFREDFLMNNIEIEMLDLLKSLKQDYGIMGVKSDFEAEGSSFDETFKLKEMLDKVSIDLYVKIGGCEAVNDLYYTKELGVKGIIAPMIESEFSARKFLNAAKNTYENNLKDVDLFINTESKTSILNIDDILDTVLKKVKGIVIGRVDLSSSMNLSRNQINGKDILDACIFLSKKALDKGLESCFGGGITFEAIPFILNMKGLVSKFESRKVIFKYDDNEKRLKEVIAKALKFEFLYLKNKEYYNTLTSIDKNRIVMAFNRIKNLD